MSESAREALAERDAAGRDARGRRRVAAGRQPRRRRAATVVRVVRPRRSARRLCIEDILGWPAGRLDPRTARPRHAPRAGTDDARPRHGCLRAARVRRGPARSRTDAETSARRASAASATTSSTCSPPTSRSWRSTRRPADSGSGPVSPSTTPLTSWRPRASTGCCSRRVRGSSPVHRSRARRTCVCPTPRARPSSTTPSTASRRPTQGAPRTMLRTGRASNSSPERRCRSVRSGYAGRRRSRGCPTRRAHRRPVVGNRPRVQPADGARPAPVPDRTAAGRAGRRRRGDPHVGVLHGPAQQRRLPLRRPRAGQVVRRRHRAEGRQVRVPDARADAALWPAFVASVPAPTARPSASASDWSSPSRAIGT